VRPDRASRSTPKSFPWSGPIISSFASIFARSIAGDVPRGLLNMNCATYVVAPWAFALYAARNDAATATASCAFRRLQWWDSFTSTGIPWEAYHAIASWFSRTETSRGRFDLPSSSLYQKRGTAPHDI